MPYYRLSLPSNRGMTAAARDSFLSLFVGSKFSPLITNTAGEKKYLSFSPPRLKLSKASLINHPNVAELSHDCL